MSRLSDEGLALATCHSGARERSDRRENAEPYRTTRTECACHLENRGVKPLLQCGQSRGACRRATKMTAAANIVEQTPRALRCGGRGALRTRTVPASMTTRAIRRDQSWRGVAGMGRKCRATLWVRGIGRAGACPSGQGQGDAHGGAGGVAVAQSDVAVVAQEDAFGDGEAEAGAVGAAGEK